MPGRRLQAAGVSGAAFRRIVRRFAGGRCAGAASCRMVWQLRAVLWYGAGASQVTGVQGVTLHYFGSADERILVAVQAADVVHVLEAHLFDHGGGLAGAGAALTVDIDRRVEVADMVHDKVDAVERHVDAALDVAPLILGAGADVLYEAVRMADDAEN